jgi:hypothetical protein
MMLDSDQHRGSGVTHVGSFETVVLLLALQQQQ